PVRRGFSVEHDGFRDILLYGCSRAMTAVFVSSGRVSGHENSFSRRSAPEVCQKTFAPWKPEGAGNAGCALHPRSHVQWVEECAHEHTGQRRTSDIPCAMALRLITGSPRRTALLPPWRPESSCLQVH